MEKKIVEELFTNVAEVELIYRSKVKPSQRPAINCSQDAANLLRQIWEEDKMDLIEQFKVLYLNRANKVLCVYNLSSGGITGTVADPRIIYATALKLNAVSLILAHNHPSGNLRPSRQDEELTEKIKMGGCYFDMKVIDHIILTSEGYLSFADEGLL